jgi:hypothetical protein
MNYRLIGVFILCLITWPAATASAQERGQAGLVAGFPASFGFIWHASDKLAVRPDLTFSFSSSESETNIFGFTSTEASGHSFTLGTTVLWYLAKHDNVRTYVAPRFAYSHSSTEVNLGSGAPSKVNGVTLAAHFGAQYTPVRKFAVFGEIGYGFNRSKSKFSTPIATSENTSRGWAPRGAVGIIYYFGG